MLLYIYTILYILYTIYILYISLIFNSHVSTALFVLALTILQIVNSFTFKKSYLMIENEDDWQDLNDDSVKCEEER